MDSGSDGCFNVKEKGNIWKDYMERVMNEKNIGIVMWKEML